jgi:hypothetical protein
VTPSDLRKAADKWMDRNPKVYGYFRHFACEAADRRQRFGMKALAERVRWECQVKTTGADFKICNSYIAYIARRLIEELPYLEEFIELRCAKDETVAGVAPVDPGEQGNLFTP